VIIVTGTPGVGKSSVSKLLASRIGAGLIAVGDLVRNEGLYIGIDRKRDTLVADSKKVLRKVERIVACSAGDVIVEGHYAMDVVSPENVRLVFVLRRDPEELREALKGRGYRVEKIRENLAAEILDVCLYDAAKTCGLNKVCEINVTARRAEDVVEEMLLVLYGKKECKVGIVDWLGKLDSEGKLDEYLREI